MNLPFRIEDAPGEPVVSVDGAYGAPGLNLSHWPGNTTPSDLKRDLSTGIALAFAALDPEERARRAAGCTAVTNNHVDTDGVCAAFAVLHPEAALAHADALLAAASAGDFFRPVGPDGSPDHPEAWRALALDATVTACVDPERSPFDLAGLEDRARHEAATLRVLEHLPRWLDPEGLEAVADLWRPTVEAWRADVADLGRATFDDLVHLDFAVWTAAPDARATRAGGEGFEPGRHALWNRTEADRVLVLAPGSAGTRARFLLGTFGWFDLPGRRTHPRPDLAALARRLNDEEGLSGDEPACWRHQSPAGASPELWFGVEGLPSFGEHATPWLRPSSLSPERVKALVTDAVRDAWSFSDDQEDEDGDWRPGMPLL